LENNITKKQFSEKLSNQFSTHLEIFGKNLHNPTTKQENRRRYRRI